MPIEWFDWLANATWEQRSELAPGRDQRGLDSVLRQVDVPKDPTGDLHATVADGAGEGIECLAVATPGPFHERSLHPSLLVR
ncbi:MAG: hypothetical protein AB1736_05800 [Chloroflexota bacterium]